jgi:NAD(P)-dependent dehydrogenase (short-subunit alcohol dehydrogenase family)/acyl carrier protein
VAAWLVERGARQLVLVGRRSPDDRAREAIARLEEAGARVTTLRADISEPGEVARLLATIADALPPLRGVVNAAGVLDDGVLLQQTAARLGKVMAPKVEGSWNLHAQTKDLPLDFFVLFSSSASLLALPGRSSYAAANAFLDALAHHRRQCGLAGLSVNWGAWVEAGMAARLGADLRRQLAERGMGDVETRPGLDMLGALIAEGKAQTGVFPINWAKLFRDARGPVPPYFEQVAVSAAEVGQSGPGTGVLAELRACPSGQRASRLAEWIRQEVAGVLGTHSASAVDPEKGFWAMGMDSLLSLELRNRLQSALGRRLDATLTMNHPNVSALARYLGGQLGLDPTDAEVAVTSRERSTGRAADAIDDLSESEVEALLLRRLDDMELGKG